MLLDHIRPDVAKILLKIQKGFQIHNFPDSDYDD